MLDQGTSCDVHVQTPYLMLPLPLICSQWVFRDVFFSMQTMNLKLLIEKMQAEWKNNKDKLGSLDVNLDRSYSSGHQSSITLTAPLISVSPLVWREERGVDLNGLLVGSITWLTGSGLPTWDFNRKSLVTNECWAQTKDIVLFVKRQ